MNGTDVNQPLSDRNARINTSPNQSLLNETRKNQTMLSNNTPVSTVGWDEALSLLLLQHANETPLPARGTETILTVGNPSYHVEHLFYNGGWVGWVEWKPQGDYATYWIRLYNLESGKERVIPVDGMKLEYYPPSMDGENIVYTGDTPGFYGSAICLYNITTNKTTILSGGDQEADKDMPVIQGRYVVYTVERYDWNYIRPDGFVNLYSNIQLIDLFTGLDIPISPVSNETRRYTPSISGENVVWETLGWDTLIPGFELYNIPTGTLLTGVANTGDIYAMPPTIDNDRIVFDRFQTDNWDYDIFLYNITTGKETNLTPLTLDSNQQDGSIQGDYVVYINDEYSNSPGLHLLHMATGITSVISSSTGVSRPEVYGNHIFWSQYDGSTWKYMMFTPGDPEPPVKADFTVNNTVGGLPFTVLFTDKSSGPVMTHHWEFGDGNDSYEVNPVHTYTTPGRYDVSLTVSSPYYRDNMYVPEMITAGAAPRSSFVMDPPSGVVGLTVHFTDTSTGYNDQWLWDFGDNSISADKNTSHRYLSPGDYTVTLTSGNQWGTDSATGTIKVINATFGETPILLPGLTAYSADTRGIVIQESGLTGYTCTLWDNSTRVDIIPEKPGSLPSFSIFSEDGTTFLEENNTISGTVKNLRLTSADLTSGEFSDHTGVYNWLTRRDEYLDEVGSNSTIQFSVDLPGFEPGSSIDTAVCRQYTVEEAMSYMYATQAADWADGPDNIA
ncbi:MAG: PKD domain-containing protein, partial [Methanomicrobiales archaeon]